MRRAARPARDARRDCRAPRPPRARPAHGPPPPPPPVPPPLPADVEYTFRPLVPGPARLLEVAPRFRAGGTTPTLILPSSTWGNESRLYDAIDGLRIIPDT